MAKMKQWASILSVGLMVCGVLLFSSIAKAEQRPEGGRVELGANLRTDFGVHFLRLDAAWAAPRYRVLLVLDPLVWTDGQTSTDLIGFFRTRTFEPFLGWRLNTIPLVEGSQLQHNLLVGTALGLPDFFGGRISGEWGIELAMALFSHGGGVPASTISFESGRHYLDRVNFGMFARFHYNLWMGRM